MVLELVDFQVEVILSMLYKILFKKLGGAPRRMDDAGQKLRPIEWDHSQLPPIKKNLYHEHASITRREQSEILQWLNSTECTLEGDNIPRPISEFSESGFPRLFNSFPF